MCPKPQSRVDLRCCLDLDSNGICDDEEQFSVQPYQATPSSIGPVDGSQALPENVIGSAEVQAYVLPAVENETSAGSEKPASVEQPTQIPILYHVDIQVFKFNPQNLTIPVNSTIVWTNNDTRSHGVSAHYNLFKSPRLQPGNTFTYTFRKPGTYTYVDPAFPQMHGTIVVE